MPRYKVGDIVRVLSWSDLRRIKGSVEDPWGNLTIPSESRRKGHLTFNLDMRYYCGREFKIAAVEENPMYDTHYLYRLEIGDRWAWCDEFFADGNEVL